MYQQMARRRRAARLQVRMSRDELRALDQLVGARHTTRSRLIRDLIARAEVESAAMPDLSRPFPDLEPFAEPPEDW
jgi:hypothetical protein